MDNKQSVKDWLLHFIILTENFNQYLTLPEIRKLIKNATKDIPDFCTDIDKELLRIVREKEIDGLKIMYVNGRPVIAGCVLRYV